MAVRTEHSFDLFVVHADADSAWVQGYFIPALGVPKSLITTEEQFSPGQPRIQEFVRAVRESRFTVVVLSPAFLVDFWGGLGEQLAAYLSVEEHRSRLIPALLHPCELPLELAFRVPLDYTSEARWDSQTRRLRSELGRPEPEAESVPTCPFPGLASYTEADSELFWGREAETGELVRRVRSAHRVVVIGPSGSGKSSLVFAGLIAELHRNEPTEWLVRVIRPGAAPLRALLAALECDASGVQPHDDPVAAVASLLACYPPARRLLLVVDQFEEALGQAPSADRKEFLAVTHALRTVPDCVEVLTLRADFYPELMHSELWPLMSGERLEVVPPRGAMLRAAIEQPALRRGVYVEQALIERLMADAATEPGVLPLLQETLRQLWAQMRHRLLTLTAYEALGRDGASGMAMALATWADASLADLPSPRRLVARRVFLRLVHLGEGRDDTRRQQSVAALRVAGEEPATLDATLRHLTDRRLLTRSGREGEEDALVDLAHEALISGWPTLRQWVTEGREAELFRRRIERDAEEWDRARHDRSQLYRGRRLKNAREWQARYPGEPGSASRAFLDSSRRLNVVLRTAMALLVVVLLLGLARLVNPLVREAQLRQAASRASPMVSLPAGLTTLGGLDQPDSVMVRRLVPAFSIDSQEVTNARYRLCVRANRCTRPLEPADFLGYDRVDGDLPVVYVTAYQAAAFCRWLARRLPSAAEWERAARGTDGRRWPWGSAAPRPGHANVIFRNNQETALASASADRFAAGATPEGIVDLVGNAAEWTATPGQCKARLYDCPQPWNGVDKVGTLGVRGSSFLSAPDPVTLVVYQEAFQQKDDVGFRCAHSD